MSSYLRVCPRRSTRATMNAIVLLGLLGLTAASPLECPDGDAACMRSLTTDSKLAKVHLLQKKVKQHRAKVVTRSITTAPLASPGVTRLHTPAPVYWLHLPKCGFSMVNWLVSNKEICPYWLEYADEVNETGLLKQDGTFQDDPDDIFFGYARHILKACPNGFFYTKESIGPRTVSNHYPLGNVWPTLEKSIAHPVVMLRQPEQRFLSDYYYSHRSSLKEDIKLGEGCQVRYLTRGTEEFCDNASSPIECTSGQSGHCWVGMAPVTDREVEIAKSRLRAFAFVGITGQWDLSMCLWNAMFNQPCTESQGANLHPTTGSTSTDYDTSVLDGYTDPYDGALYAEGLRIFHESLLKYNVSESSCRRACNVANS